MEKSVINRICVLMDSLAGTERKVANYIIHNPQKAINMTIMELARECGVSKSSVSRFCRSVDMEGFHHLKISIAGEIAGIPAQEQTSEHISADDIRGSLNHILANKVEELTQTISGMDIDVLRKVLETINKADTVLIAAVGNTVPVAMDGAYKLNQLGIRAVAPSIWETSLGYSYNLGQDDAVIVISNSGESVGCIQILEAAAESGASTISITNNEASSVALKSNYHLTTASRERLLLDGCCFSRVSAAMVMEIIYLLLASMREQAYDSIVRHEQAMASTKE